MARAEMMLVTQLPGDSEAFHEAVRIAWHHTKFHHLHWTFQKYFAECARRVRADHLCRCGVCRNNREENERRNAPPIIIDDSLVRETEELIDCVMDSGVKKHWSGMHGAWVKYTKS